MSVSVVVKDTIPKFTRENAKKFDRAFESVAEEIARDARMIAPKSVGSFGVSTKRKRPANRASTGLLHGALKDSIRVERVGSAHYKVTAGENPGLSYALAQEVGGNGRVTFKNYSTPGTGKQYLKRSADHVKKQLISRIRSYLST